MCSKVKGDCIVLELLPVIVRRGESNADEVDGEGIIEGVVEYLCFLYTCCHARSVDEVAIPVSQRGGSTAEISDTSPCPNFALASVFAKGFTLLSYGILKRGRDTKLTW
jgi:hypothetical protein